MRSILLLSTLIFALTGCKAIWNPTFMPSGYTYQHDDVPTVPGPDAPEKIKSGDMQENAAPAQEQPLDIMTPAYEDPYDDAL